MSFDDRVAVAEFVVESRRRLADIESRFRAIEATGDNVDHELISQAFQAVHSIEQAAARFGFAALQGLALKLERLLRTVRDRQLEPPSAVTGIFLRVACRFREMMEDIESSSAVRVSQ
jgi:chemotaxis protein histidine kinase CheA